MAFPNKVRRDLALLLVFAASIAETGGITLYAHSLTCGSEVSDVRQAFSSAYLAGDERRLAAVYSEDAVLRPPGREIQGREAIVAYFIGRKDRHRISHTLRSESLDEQGSMAVDKGIWEAAWQDSGRAVRSAHGRYVIVWARDTGGIWRIARESWRRPLISSPPG